MVVATVATSQKMLEEAKLLARSCYQCGRCGGACPMAFAMDLTPRQLLRLLQLDLAEDALRSNSPWLCAGCFGCSFSCPRGVDLTKVMYLLRQQAAAEGISNKSISFYREFVAGIQAAGAVYEPKLMLAYARRVGPEAVLPHLRMGAELALRGKLIFRPRSIAEKEQLGGIIRQVMEDGER